jgi:DNA-binding CsgD family transcriptional regulator
VFQEETRRALEYAARGISVRIVGGVGSGRSTVAQAIIAELEKTGAEVYPLFGARLLRKTPLAGVGHLGLDMRARLNGPRGMADVLSERLAQRGAKVIVVDDIDMLDNESLAVIDIVQKRTKRPLVMTMGDSSLYSGSDVFTPDRWPEAQIRLGPLRYDQVDKLVTDTLAAPPDVDSTAHILMKSAGNPRLVVRLAQSAVLSKLLVLSDGQWRMAGHTLWNEHLHSTVEALLYGLGPDELTALHTLSLLGTRPMECLQQTIDSDVLDNLERRGLVAVMEDANYDVCVAVSPPIIVDYFRDHHVLSSRRVLADRIARVVDSPLQHTPVSGQLSPQLAGLVGELRGEAGTGGAATARHFQEQLRVLEEAHYAMWESEKTLSNAAAFLRFYWGGPLDPERIEEVFNNTETADSDPAEYFFFTMTRALWAIASGDGVSVATGMIRELGKTSPDWQAEAEAFAAFLNASYDRMPSNLDEILNGLTSRQPTSGVLPVIRGMLELYRFDAQAALAALDSAEGFDLVANVEPFVRGLALLVAGRSDEALNFSLDQRATAQQTLNQFGFVASSYVAALALTRRGLTVEAEYMMSSVFALGRPGFLVNSLHDAMLRIAGMRSATGSGRKVQSLGAQARKDVADVGPLPGIGKGVYDLFSQQYNDTAAFDDKAVTLLEQQLDHGYVMEAVYASLFMLCLLPGRRVLDRLQSLLSAHGVTSHDQLLAIAAAAIDCDYQLLGILLDQYEPDSDLFSVGMLIKGASKRRLLERDHDAAGVFQQLSQDFEARFPAPGQHPTLSTSMDQPQPLSPRETEIAVLAGSQTNPEIASRLGISTRTVENHISRALRKSGTFSRKDLYEFVQSSRR